jgi:hypothetical protein
LGAQNVIAGRKLWYLSFDLKLASLSIEMFNHENVPMLYTMEFGIKLYVSVIGLPFNGFASGRY